MPNYIKNRIVIDGTPEQIQQVFDKFNTFYPATVEIVEDNNVLCKNKTGAFGRLDLKTGQFISLSCEINQVGLPENWEIYIKQAVNHFPDFNKIIPQPDEILNDNLEGVFPEWYHWRIDNWGTKWNALEPHQENYNTFIFETAWSGVPNLILEMSKQSPEVLIKYEYADEDTGSNCAEYIFKGGETIKVNEPEKGSKEAYELAFRLRPHDKDDYVFIDGNYKFKD